MIEIIMKDGSTVTYDYEEYTNYMYDGKCFVIVYGEQYIGMYNIDAIRSVTIER